MNLRERPQTSTRKAWDSDLWRVVPVQGPAVVEIRRFESNPETNRRAKSLLVDRFVWPAQVEFDAEQHDAVIRDELSNNH